MDWKCTSSEKRKSHQKIMAKGIALGNYRGGSKKKRPGIHSKTKTSRSKNAKHYKKIYVGQGR